MIPENKGKSDFTVGKKRTNILDFLIFGFLGACGNVPTQNNKIRLYPIQRICNKPHNSFIYRIIGMQISNMHNGKFSIFELQVTGIKLPDR